MDLHRLETPRLRLRIAEPALAVALADFTRRNRDHTARWDPPRLVDLDDPAVWVPRLIEWHAAAEAGRELRWVMQRRPEPGRDAVAPEVIGRVSIAPIERGPFQSARLGYVIDAAYEGQGLMREALQAVIDYLFTSLGLHRIEANYRPENARSGALLQRLGFETLGLAPRYLFIDGDWRDHVITHRLNPAFDASVFAVPAALQ